MFRRSIKNGLLEIRLLDENYGSWDDFEGIFNTILKNLKGKIIKQQDGVMNREWTMSILNEEVSFYYQDMIGIFIYATRDPSANSLVEEIASYLEKDWKERGIWEKLGYK